MNKMRGYFLFLAVVFILVIGLMGVLISYLSASRAMLSVNQLNGLKVFYNAESGLDITTRYLTRPSFSSPARISCASVSGTAQLTNASLNGGTFTATTTNSSPIYVTNTLSSAVTAAVTTIPAISTAGFAPNGRILIDKEAIDYAGISGNSFIGATRGTGGTSASSHAGAAPVSQYQCSIDVQAGIPSIASPSYQRELQWNVILQDGYAVGNNNSNIDTIVNWNNITELKWIDNSLTVSTGSILNAVSMLSNADGWAVGDRIASGFTFLRWNGSNWSSNVLAGACSGQHLYGVSMVSSTQGFAVGARYRPACASNGNFRYTLLSWNGTAWSLLAPPTIPADASALQNLNAVHVMDTDGDGLANIGFAVGDGGTILRYNGSSWVTDASPVASNLNGVYTVSASEAWAVGASGVILRWNGSVWSSYSSPTTTALNAVSMLDTNGDGLADYGLAVGNSSKVERYNGSTWSETDLGGTNFFAVDIFDTQDAWLAGASGVMYHWDGSSWTSAVSSTTRQLNGISLVRSGQAVPTSIWRQIFH